MQYVSYFKKIQGGFTILDEINVLEDLHFNLGFPNTDLVV